MAHGMRGWGWGGGRASSTEVGVTGKGKMGSKYICIERGGAKGNEGYMEVIKI